MQSRSLAMMRNFASTTTASTSSSAAAAAASASASAVSSRLEVPNPSTWKRGHNPRGSVGERIQVIPGFKTSAAFLSSLGANLRISDDDLLPSPTNTPALRPIYDFHHNLPPPSPLAHATMADNAGIPPSSSAISDPKSELDEIPPLSLTVANTDTDIVLSLKRIADSVAQQRNLTARTLIFHPLNLAVFVVVFSAIMQYIYRSPADLAKAITTGTGICMLYLVAIRQYASPYVFEAENINLNWLGEDQIVISKFGEDVIGALVLGWEKGEGRGNKRKKWGRGVVRAWTVRLKYRGKGVGTDLLEEAVRITKEKGGEEIVFSDDHANGKRFLPAFYNTPMDRAEAKYKKQLEGIWNADRSPVKGKR